MIKLTKGPEPAVLTDNFATWTHTLTQKSAQGVAITSADKAHYRHKDIKSALLTETSGKCAYCESKLRHITYGDIEHIVPKSSDIALTFKWENLTIACDVCNTNKSDHFADSDEFVDPYTVSPEDHFFFSGPFIFPKGASERAKLTESRLQLNRAELLERRKERMEYLHSLIEIYCRTTNHSLKQILLNDIVNQETAHDREYAALSRRFIADAL